MIGIDAFDRLLARRVDRRGIDHVGIVECAFEVIHVIAQAREAVRLDHGDDAPLHAFARSGQHGADFHRVVAVIVDHCHATALDRDLADFGEAALHAAELGEAGLDAGIRAAHLHRNADGGERVLDIVAARHRQFDALDPAERAIPLAQRHVEAIAARNRRHVLAANVGLCGETVSHHAAVAHFGDHRLHFGVIDAEQRAAVERHVLDEFDEGVLHLVERTVVIEMLGIDVRHDGNGAVEAKEGTIALVRFHDHPVALAKARVGAVGVDDAAVDDGGVDPTRIEQRRHHRSRGGLAVGAGHRDGVLQAHQFGQHFRAAHHGDAVFERVDHFRILTLHGSGGDNHGRSLNVLCRVADRDLDAPLAQAFDHIPLGNIGALHTVAEVVHHLGNAGHADAADANEVDRADVGADALHATPPLRARASPLLAGTVLSIRITSMIGLAPKLSTRSARSLAALG